jgi:formylglycine-generating enzyme required for sulfatase activity
MKHDTTDPRIIALQAAARGWIGPADVWDAACRWVLEGRAATASDLFRRSLDSEQIASLRAGMSTMETIGHVTEPSEPPPALDSEPTSLHGAAERYSPGELLGRGGIGVVTAALDRDTGRVVALKRLSTASQSDPRVTREFLEEARVTAQLEHPNIVPVYDVGVLRDGQPFYTMRVIKRRSLSDVLYRDELRPYWPLARLLGVFLQVTRALAYAHSRGVLHRDIKPENVLLGDFGEVYVADWGIAKVQPASVIHKAAEEAGASYRTSSSTRGTVGYIAPEVLRGEADKIDHRADLFALGVVLYEILTGRHPFHAPTGPGMMLATCQTHPRLPREIVASCPLLLEDLCLALIAKDPKDRPASADEVAAAIETFLEGAKEKERRREEALSLCQRAREPVGRFRSLEAEHVRLAEQARETLKSVKGWEPVERKRPGWTLEQRAAEAERDAGRALAEAIELYTKAIGYDAECADAHRGLADLYWSRARLAEQERRPAAQVYYEALVTDHDVGGTYAELLKEDARLSLRSNPAGAHVIAQRYYERDHVLVPGEERYLGRTPLEEARLEPGSYLVTLKGTGYRDVRYPVLLGRGGHHAGEINLYRDDEIGEGFVYVPGGAAIFGGDPDAYDPLPRQELVVPDFAIARFPVTMREYCAFLDHLDAARPGAADERAHQGREDDPPVRRGKDGKWEPDPSNIEGEARKLFPIEDGHLWNVPANTIDWFDAVAYCAWRSEVDGATVRLATEVEWEKAARGVDGRLYPWGDRFDPVFCLTRESRSFVVQPEPVGTFATDESPYGARDMAGGMREWVADIYGEKTAAELAAEPQPPPGTERGASSMRQVRSGSWRADRNWARAASRGGQFALITGAGLGFRCARTLTPPRRKSY